MKSGFLMIIHIYAKVSTSINKEQGAWWEVDLGAVKTINQIIIYNRTDCCEDRLSNYQVTISTKTTNTYQEKFSSEPHPKAVINLGKYGKKGRYVKIQLLDDNYLSLAEVEVMGPDKGDEDAFFVQIGDEVSLKEKNNLVIAGGYIRVSDSNSQCDINSEGAIRYNTLNKIIEFCDAIAWNPINATPDCDWVCQLGSANSAGGLYHSCALKTDSTVECWGDNSHKQTKVPKRLIAKQIALGGYHTCALRANNTVKCWGLNINKQTEVSKRLIAKQIALGVFHTCALRTDNTVKCWGLNGNKQTDVSKGLVAKQIALGEFHSCALKTDNTVERWGKSSGHIAVPSGLIAKQL